MCIKYMSGSFFVIFTYIIMKLLTYLFKGGIIMTQKQFDKMWLKTYGKVCSVCLAIAAIFYGITIHKYYGWGNLISEMKLWLNSRKETNMNGAQDN